MPPSQDWDIRSRSDRCAGSEAVFEDGQVIWSRLCHSEESGYIRQDYADAAWKALDDKTGISVWKSVFRRPPPPDDKEAFKKENAETLLRRLVEEEDEQYRNTIYILALMLERKRILVEQDVQVREDGAHIRIYEHKKSGESFLIFDPQLKLAELEKIQEEVVLMLGGRPRNAAEIPGDGTAEGESGAGAPGSESAAGAAEQPADESPEGNEAMRKREDIDDEDETQDDEFEERPRSRRPRRDEEADDEFDDEDDEFDEDEDEDDFDDEDEE